MNNRQWWEATWSNIYDLPATVRVSLKYGNLKEHYDRFVNHNNEALFYPSFCKPSQERYTKYLRNANKEKMVQLHATPYNTFIPGVGYKTKHYRTDEDVYVIQHDFAPAITRSEDRPQEYVQIVKTLVYWGSGLTYEGKFHETVLSRQSNVSLRYVDKLTKKQREALAVLKIMDVNGYVEGMGYRKEFNKYKGWDADERRSLYENVVLYFLDGIKKEDEQ